MACSHQRLNQQPSNFHPKALTTLPHYTPVIHTVYLLYINNSLLSHREHCLAVKELYCYKEWRSAEDRSLRGFPHSLSITLPECSSLPSQQSDPSSCTTVPYVGKSDMVLYKPTFSCVISTHLCLVLQYFSASCQLCYPFRENNRC